jgi:ferrochelatase
MAERVAIVLFNLGGPDALTSVRPFLMNLFTDKAILRVPWFIRPILARIIAHKRVKAATENYQMMGGKSPLLDLTLKQAAALEKSLPELDVKCFVAMRYWHPMSAQTAREVKAWNPDRILLLPLYPHYSTTTTGSSLEDWREAASKAGLTASVTSLCCWPNEGAYAAATAALLRKEILQTRELYSNTSLRVLFSAHGLPEIIVEQGDPYQWQIELCVDAVVRELAEENLDWQICYQSRATPQKWLEPSTSQAIEQAAHDKVGLIVVPIAFVSEHSETLVELDHEYGDLAFQKGVPFYVRVPAQNSDQGFIEALAGIVRGLLGRGHGLFSVTGSRICPGHRKDCPMKCET